ncbi:hypothetical protein F5Y11DRAFT_337874 [Daldinia sp. FL1419]|nr:hypothetical protein F5Y11DRAFT_337874 [Daldinia sp. FL1419]
MDPPTSSFNTADECVDRLERLAKLRLFISGGLLTRDEQRYIKVLLSDVKADIIDELPIEIVRLIVQLLDLPDFVSCLAVSRRWREKLLSLPVIGLVAEELCPSLAHSRDQVTADSYLNALHRIGRLRWKSCYSVLVKDFSWKYESYFKLDPTHHSNHNEPSTVYAQFSHDDNPEPDYNAYRTALYCHGKIAWIAKSRIVVVDDLWTRTRKIFTIPTGALIGPTLELLALGDRLVVGAVNRTLVAWDHTTNKFLEKKLPSTIRYAGTQGTRVAMLLFDGNAFIWEFGSKVCMFATAPLKQYHGLSEGSLRSWASNLRIFFHPTCSRTIFLASGYTTTSDSGLKDATAILKRVVYELKDATHTKTFEIEIPAKVCNPEDIADAKVDIQKVLPYRRDIIGFCERYYRPRSFVMPYPYEPFVEFDIYKRQFTARIDRLDNGEFGWRGPLEDADLDFEIGFHSNGFAVTSYRPDFEFKIGE